MNTDPDPDTQALLRAVELGQLSKAKKLLNTADVSFNQYQPLRNAAQHGDMAMVQLLLPLSDPKSYGSGALRHAARNGHIDIVKLLLPLSDTSFYFYEILRLAIKDNNEEMAQLLATGGGLEEALAYEQKSKFFNDAALKKKKMITIAWLEHNILQQNMPTKNNARHKKI